MTSKPEYPKLSKALQDSPFKTIFQNNIPVLREIEFFLAAIKPNKDFIALFQNQGQKSDEELQKQWDELKQKLTATNDEIHNEIINNIAVFTNLLLNGHQEAVNLLLEVSPLKIAPVNKKEIFRYFTFTRDAFVKWNDWRLQKQKTTKREDDEENNDLTRVWCRCEDDDCFYVAYVTRRMGTKYDIIYAMDKSEEKNVSSDRISFFHPLTSGDNVVVSNPIDGKLYSGKVTKVVGLETVSVQLLESMNEYAEGEVVDVEYTRIGIEPTSNL